jgi:hypothetical protein
MFCLRPILGDSLGFMFGWQHSFTQDSLGRLAFTDAAVAQLALANVPASSAGSSDNSAAVVGPIACHSGSGSSIYMTHLNMARRQFKDNLGGRAMTLAEMRRVEEEARESWVSMSEASKAAVEMIYHRGVRRRREGLTSTTTVAAADTLATLASPPSFSSPFGIGCAALPILPAKFCEAGMFFFDVRSMPCSGVRGQTFSCFSTNFAGQV